MRPSKRANNQLRDIRLTTQYTKYAEGAVLVEYGETKVICTATVSPTVPPFLKDKKQGWITAEYGMLPRSTHDRMHREAVKGKQSGRTQEIQRLIARSLRAGIDLTLLGEYTITVDCDVIQADGGTRTAAITGGCVALVNAVQALQKQKKITKNPIKQLIASISVGIYKGMPILDLDYLEDSTAEADMNVVMTEHNSFIEIQATAENGNSFPQETLDKLLVLSKEGIQQLIDIQKKALNQLSVV